MFNTHYFNISLKNTVVATGCLPPADGINMVPVPAGSYQYDSTYQYECREFYETSSSLVTQCQSDGTWSLDPPPTCSRKLFTLT